MYTFFLLLAALSLQKLHVAGALHRLFLVRSSLTNQHCTVAATQHTDLVIFILHSPVCRQLRIFNLFLVFTPKLSEGHSSFFLCARAIRVLCDMLNHVSRFRHDHVKNSYLTAKCAVEKVSLFSLLPWDYCLQAARVQHIVCAVPIYLLIGVVGCQSAESSVNIEQLILDIFPMLLLPWRKTSTVRAHRVTVVHDLVPNFPRILQFTHMLK